MCCYKNNGVSKGIHGVGKRILIPMSMEIQIFTTSVLLEEHMHHVPMGCATGYYRYKYSCVVMRTMEWTTAGQVILLPIPWRYKYSPQASLYILLDSWYLRKKYFHLSHIPTFSLITSAVSSTMAILPAYQECEYQCNYEEHFWQATI